MKVFKKIYLLLFILICSFMFNINNVFAIDIKIEDVKITEKSDNVITSDIEFNDNSTQTNIEFKELNDFVTYKLTLRNNDNKKYNIEDIMDDNSNENIKVTYKYDDKEIKAKDTQDIYVTLKYDKKLYNKKQITLSDLTITLNLEDEAGNKVISNINPKTGDNVIHFIILFVVALLVLLFSIILIKRRKGKGLLLLLLFIPCVIMAKVQLKFNIKFTNITIDGEMLPYTISVKDSEGNITDRTIIYGDSVGELPVPSKDGYTFEKYEDQYGNEVTDETIVEGDMTVTPKFNLIKYNITYELNGGTVTNPDKYTVEDEITLNNPTKVGYTFSGWTGSNGNDLQTRVTIVNSTGDLNYVANYSANQDTSYTVIHRYPKLDGTYEEINENLHGATDTTIKPSLQEKEGFTGPALEEITISGDGTSTVTYTYTRNAYNFSITDRTYVDDTSTDNGSYPHGTEITVKALQREGYTFKWSDDDTNYERVFELKGNKTLTPIYTPNTNTSYTVIHKYQKLDGTYEEETENLNGTTDTKVTPDVKGKEGFTSPMPQEITISGDGTTTLTYTYTRKNYNFSITDRTYLDDSSTENGSYPYGTKITLKANERTGYTFEWSDGDNNYERTFELKDNTTLTPVYTSQTCIISFNTNGGSEISSQSINCGEKVTKPSNPTKEDYKFINWYTDDTFENVFDFDTEIYENKVVYAKWVHPIVYFQLPPDWHGSTVNAYLFNALSSTGMTWPGDSMNLVDSTKQIYSYVLSDEQISSYDRIVFTNGESVDSGSNLNKNARQTIDIVLSDEMYEQIFVPELYSGEGTRVLFRNASKNWIQHIYKWNNSNTSINNGWPGLEFTDSINDSTYYTIVESKYNMMIFNKGTGGSGNQTNDLSVPAYQDMVYTISNSGPYRIFYFGGWKDYSEWNNTGYDDWTSDTGDYIKFVNSNPNYTVTFNANGGGVSPNLIEVTKGNTIGTLPTPNPPINKLFDGWYTNLTDGVKVDSTYIPNGNITLYAKYNDCSEFVSDSWSTIVANVKENQEYYPVGCTKEVSMPSFYIKPSRPLLLRVSNNTTPEECYEEGFSQTACGFVLEFANTVSFVKMNDTNTNVGGWRDSLARNYINTTIYNDLPTELKNSIIDTTVVSGYGSSDSSNFTTTDKLYLLSRQEVYGDNSTYDTSSLLTRQLDYYKKLGITTSNYSKASKAYYATGNGSGWWLRSASYSSNSSFASVGFMGSASSSTATDSNNTSVSPAFRIG